MTTWTRTDDGLEAVIGGHDYLIAKHGTAYILFCDEIETEEPLWHTIADAKTAAEDHAAAPAPTKQGVHMDEDTARRLVDMLRRSFPWSRVQDFADESPYDEPDTGAPEPQS